MSSLHVKYAPQSSKYADFLTLTKPKVVVLMLITAVVGMILASPSHPPLSALIFGTLGIGAMAAASAAMNHIADSRIDRLMQRTQSRPIASGRLSHQEAMVFSILLMVTSIVILSLWVNVLTALLALATLVGYSGVYTLYLKRATSQNIVIGGFAGSIPPVLGWTSVSNSLDPGAWLLALIIFTWTPPHFWALAIYRIEEYRKAKIPMLPVTHGIPTTKWLILLYSILLLLVSVLPFIIRMQGLLYLMAAVILGATMIAYAIKLIRTDEPIWAMKAFRWSSIYLMLLFVAMVIDHVNPWLLR